METFISVCNKTNIHVSVLENINSSCCSQIFSSKGFEDAYRFTANNIIQKLWKSSKEGMLPVVIDVSSCAYTLHNIRPILSDENKIKFDSLLCSSYSPYFVGEKKNSSSKGSTFHYHPTIPLLSPFLSVSHELSLVPFFDIFFLNTGNRI